MIVVSVWADQWWAHNETSFTIGQALVQVAKLMAVYVAAASVLGEPEAKIGIDLKEHYYAARRVTYGLVQRHQPDGQAERISRSVTYFYKH